MLSGNWFPSFHYNDLSGWKNEGMPLSTPSDEAAKLLDAYIAEVVFHDSDPTYGTMEDTSKQMLNADPDFVMGKTVKYCLESFGANPRKETKLIFDINEFIKSTECKVLNKWEKDHVKALKYISEEDWVSAINVYDDILVQAPRDIFALQMGFFAGLFTANRQALRGLPSKVIKEYPQEHRYFGNVHGKLCFGHEECGQIELAEKSGNISLSHTPNDIWTIHSISHIKDATLEAEKGITFLHNTEGQWTPRKGLVTHVWWHLALFHVQLGQFEEALELLDNKITEDAKSDKGLFVLSDATSLLMRLELEGKPIGVDLKDRWREIGEIYENNQMETAGAHIFYDFHTLIALLFGDKRKAAKELMEKLDSLADGSTNKRWNSFVLGRVGKELCGGLLAFADDDFGKCVDLMYPIRHDLASLIGGSKAQTSILLQILIGAAVKAGKDYIPLANQLLQEQVATCGYKAENSLHQRLAEKIGVLI